MMVKIQWVSKSPALKMFHNWKYVSKTGAIIILILIIIIIFKCFII